MSTVRSEIRSARSSVASEARQLNIHTDWAEFLTEAAASRSIPAQVWRNAVVRESRTYMRRLDLFGQTAAKLVQRLSEGAPVVRVSHQPNLFCAFNIIGLIVLADMAAKQIGGVLVFVGVDYDEAGDRRFRTSLLPNSGKAPTYLPSSVRSVSKDAVACTIGRPSQVMLERWLDMHEHAIRTLAKTLGCHITHESRRERYEMYRCLSRSLTEYNAAMIADFVKQFFDVDMLVVPASKLFSYMSTETQTITDVLVRDDPTLRTKLIWRVCPHCFKRCPVDISNKGSGVAMWHCKACSYSLVEGIDWSALIHVPTGTCPAFLPRITLDEMIDYEIARSAATVSYAGGTEHILRSRKLGQRTGFPLAPEFIWEPTGMSVVGATEPLFELWSKGKFSSHVYGRLFGQEKLRSEILISLATAQT